MRELIRAAPSAAAPGAPRLLIYIIGHLRTFPLLSWHARATFDALAAGPHGYAVFMHTWRELDHRDVVWFRSAKDAAAARAPATSPSLLRTPRLNALLQRAFVAEVEDHPGSAELGSRWLGRAMQRRLNGLCFDHQRGLRCADHAIAHVVELARAHALALAHNPAAVARCAEGGFILQTRPDVLIPELLERATLPRLDRIFGSHAHEEGQRSSAGHVGPWEAGWSDIVFVVSTPAMHRLRAALPTLGSLVDDLPHANCSSVCGATPRCDGASTAATAQLARRWRSGACCAVCAQLVQVATSRRLHAEQLWRWVLLRVGVERFRGGFFLRMAKARVALARGAGGDWTLGVAHWHAPMGHANLTLASLARANVPIEPYPAPLDLGSIRDVANAGQDWG